VLFHGKGTLLRGWFSSNRDPRAEGPHRPPDSQEAEIGTLVVETIAKAKAWDWAWQSLSRRAIGGGEGRRAKH
jgi:hypothetical protein